MGTAGGVDRTSRQPLSSGTIASGLPVHILFMLCCKHGFAFDKCEEAEVVMQRALFEGAREGWLDNGKRGYQSVASLEKVRASTCCFGLGNQVG